jgi:hypothetical protein
MKRLDGTERANGRQTFVVVQRSRALFLSPQVLGAKPLRKELRALASEAEVIKIRGIEAFWTLEASYLRRWFYTTTALPKSYKTARLTAHTTNHDLVTIF